MEPPGAPAATPRSLPPVTGFMLYAARRRQLRDPSLRPRGAAPDYASEGETREWGGSGWRPARPLGSLPPFLPSHALTPIPRTEPRLRAPHMSMARSSTRASPPSSLRPRPHHLPPVLLDWARLSPPARARFDAQAAAVARRLALVALQTRVAAIEGGHVRGTRRRRALTLPPRRGDGAAADGEDDGAGVGGGAPPPPQPEPL